MIGERGICERAQPLEVWGCVQVREGRSGENRSDVSGEESREGWAAATLSQSASGLFDLFDLSIGALGRETTERRCRVVRQSRFLHTGRGVL